MALYKTNTDKKWCEGIIRKTQMSIMCQDSKAINGQMSFLKF